MGGLRDIICPNRVWFFLRREFFFDYLLCFSAIVNVFLWQKRVQQTTSSSKYIRLWSQWTNNIFGIKREKKKYSGGNSTNLRLFMFNQCSLFFFFKKKSGEISTLGGFGLSYIYVFIRFFVVVVAYAVVVFFVFKLFVVDFYVYIIYKWFYFAHFFLSTTKTKPKTKRIQNILYLFYFSVNYDSALIWIKGTWYNNIK